MAFLEAYNVEGEIPTGTGTDVVLTVPHTETRTPIAAQFLISNCASYGSETADEWWFCALAVPDGTAYASKWADDAVTTSDVFGRSDYDYTGPIQAQMQNGSGTILLRVDLDGTGNTGPGAGTWTINASTNTIAGAKKVVATLFFGEGRSAELVKIPNATAEGAYNLSTSFQADCGIWLGSEDVASGSVAATQLGYHYGTTQACFSRVEQDGQDTTALLAYVSDAACSIYYDGNERTHYAVTAVNADSIDFNITTPTGSTVRGVNGLIFDLDSSQSAYVGVDAGFLSGGVDDYAISTGFRPAWLQGVFTNIPLGSEDTEISNANASTLSIMSMDALGVGHSLAAASRDDVGITDAKTKVRHNTGGGQWFSGYINSTSADSHAAYSYTGVPFVSDGLALRAGEYTDPDFATARAWPVFALQAATPTFTGYSSSLKLLLDASNRSATSTEVNGEASVTFTGTGGAGRTYWGADGVLQTTTGNELAWNTDPVTGVVGLQCHAAYQNEVKDSEDVEAASWATTGTLAAAVSATGPDGVSGSAQVIEDTDAGEFSNYFAARSATAAADETWTLVFKFEKDAIPATTRYSGARMEFVGGAAERFAIGIDTSTGDVGTKSQGTGAGTIVSGRTRDQGDWWLVEFTCTNSSDASNTQLNVRIYPSMGDNINLTTTNATVTGSVTVSQIQCTKSPVPLPYFKTTGTAAGPSADTPIATGWTGYSATGGVFYADFDVPGDPTSGSMGTWVYVDNSADANQVVRVYETSDELACVIKAGSNQYVEWTPMPRVDKGGNFRAAVRVQEDNMRHAGNGFFASADTSGTVPSGLDEILFGSNGAGNDSPLMYLRALRYYDDATIPDGGPQAGEDDLSLYNLSMGLVTEEAAAAATPAAGGAGSGMKGKGKAFARAKGTPRYPRRVVINGQVYTVRNPQEEHALLQLLLQREKEQLDLVEAQAIDAPMPESAKRKRVNIRKLEARLATAEANTVKWGEVLDDWDEDIIMLLSN